MVAGERAVTDVATIVRNRFPAWRRDPYQKAAVDALLRILFAGEAVQTKLGRLEEAIACFLEDPPSSLAFDAPARQCERLAASLQHLARSMLRNARALRDLRAYADQFDDSHSDTGEKVDARVRQQDLGARSESGDTTPF